MSAFKNSGKGILNLEAGKHKFVLRRYKPSSDIGFFIEWYWVVKWDLRGQEPYRQVVIAHPNINMVIERDTTRIYGISKTTTSQLLSYQGQVVGIKFRPGGFYPFWQSPISGLTGLSLSCKEVFGIDGITLEDDVLNQEDDERMVEQVEHFFRQRLPARDENVELTNRIVDTIIEEQEINKVDDIVERLGINKRTIQRLFSRYVGVSPKWVINRFRLHDAADRIDKGEVLDWLQLSLELGYYDQAHFIKDFKAIIGKTPEDYVREKEL